MTQSLRDVGALTAVLGRYWLQVIPRARRELIHWRRVAEAIPNPVLRDLALSTLSEKELNCEGATVFATLAPRAHRPAAIRAMIAFQALFDYLDTVNERKVADPLRDGLQLHLALIAALDPKAPTTDYYRFHPDGEDGGYLEALIAACRENMRALPAAGAVRPPAIAAARRCGAGQAHTHAAIFEGTERLAEWAGAQERAEGYEWWEMAAGGISSVGVHALLGAGADPLTGAAEAARLDAAYFPSVCALSTLLDSLIDREDDSATANLSTIAHYETNLVAAERLAFVVADAAARARGLRHGRGHAVIGAGIAAFYLSAPEARTPFARPIRERVVDGLGPMARPILASMGVRRRLRGSAPTR